MDDRCWLETIACVPVLQICNLSNFELNANAQQNGVTALTEMKAFGLRSCCCCSKRNDVTVISKAQRNNEALIKPVKWVICIIGILALKIIKLLVWEI